MDPKPFAPTAHVYDLRYEPAGKDYAAEADALHQLMQSCAQGRADHASRVGGCTTGTAPEEARTR